MIRPTGYSIVTPTVLLTSSIAAIAIVVGALVSYPLIVASSQDVGQRNLSQLANVTANTLELGRGNRGLGSNLVATLQRESITAYLFSSTATPETRFEDLPPGFTQDSATKLIAGSEISERSDTSQGQFLFEGRPLSSGGAVLLVQPVSVAGASAGEVIARLAVALAIGLVIAIPLGYLAARRLARPLKSASKAASQMAQGARGIHVSAEGPREVSEIAHSLNALDQALATSEGRQREFLLSVSHELRTPLTAVRGYGEALADGVMGATEAESAGAVIVREAQRLDRLVNDLLDLARLGAVDFTVEPTELDLADFAAQICQVWTHRCLDLGVHFQGNTDIQGSMFVDSFRVRQIIDNLAENALRVTPGGGTISFDMALIEPHHNSRSLRIVIEDTGPGLTPDDISIAFAPGALYERYRGVRPVGTGLGLALVDRLAQGLGGSASVENVQGSGAKFVIVIPEMKHVK